MIVGKNKVTFGIGNNKILTSTTTIGDDGAFSEVFNGCCFVQQHKRNSGHYEVDYFATNLDQGHMIVKSRTVFVQSNMVKFKKI